MEPTDCSSEAFSLIAFIRIPIALCLTCGDGEVALILRSRPISAS